jgi:hypothetical protein
MRTALPTPQRIVPRPNAETIWLAPVSSADPRLHKVVQAHHPDAWDFQPARPAKGKEWPKEGRFVPRVFEIRSIPGVDGTPDPASPFPQTQADPVSKARNRGVTVIENGDPRLGDDEEVRYWLCALPVAGGRRILHASWEVAERVGNRLEWRLDAEAYNKFLAALAKIVPPMSEARYREIRSDLELVATRKAARASRSDLATRDYEDHREIIAQCERTWATYSAAHPPQRIRVATSRVTA